MAVLFIMISKYYQNLLRISAKARFTDCVNKDIIIL